MERLSNKTLENAINVYETTIKACEGYEYDDDAYNPILDKVIVEFLKELQEYRKLEEHGRLIKLPYKAGERVWILYKDKQIEEIYVASIQIGEKYDRLCFADGYVYTIWNKDYEEVKKWIYTSKEEAEKALERMKGE